MKIHRKPRKWWEVFFGKQPIEYVTFFNPLKLTTGSHVSLSLDGYSGLDFSVTSVEEYNRKIGDENFVHTCYTLTAKPIGENPVVARLLVNDDPNATSEDAYTFETLLLRQLHEQQWDEDIQKAFDDAVSTGTFFHEEDGLNEEGVKVREPFRDEFDRVGGLRSAYEATVAEVKDRNKDGILCPSEVRTYIVRYADFSREVEDAPGVKNMEFVFFEMHSKTGFVTMWKGDRIDPSRITSI